MEVWHNQSAKQGLGKMNINFSSPKPEMLLERVLQISTLPGDIVVDYHLWSGTTAAVAHKMGRQYIGIEQMDYIETTATERMKKVIEWEQGGISKTTNWKGGGEFVYFELAEWNEEAKKHSKGWKYRRIGEVFWGYVWAIFLELQRKGKGL